MKRGGFSSYGPPLGDAIFAHEYITTSKKMPISARMLFLINCGFVDCGKNEELFLAIAALRNDSDIHQWFVHQDGSFLKCDCDSKIDMWGDYEYPQEVYPRKATIEELIKHYGHESI